MWGTYPCQDDCSQRNVVRSQRVSGTQLVLFFQSVTLGTSHIVPKCSCTSTTHFFWCATQVWFCVLQLIKVRFQLQCPQ